MRQYKYRRSQIYKNTQNKKRILCYNILHSPNTCKYGAKCDYAHSLDDQIIDPIRDKVYNMLRKDVDMTLIDLIHDKELYNTLSTLTRVCRECSKKLCPGGYNCRMGALNEKYRICYDDMMYGTCSRGECKYIHLTNKGLKPYIIQKKIHDNKVRSNSSNKWNMSHPVINTNTRNTNTNTNTRNNEYVINKILDGSLLTDKILRSYLDDDLDNLIDSDTDSSTEDFKIETVIDFIEHAKGVSYDEYIKLPKNNKNNKG